MMSVALRLVLAFGSADDFDTPAALGGGEGIHFTGSPTSKWNCSVCHDATGAGSVTVTSTGRDLVTQGYVPGETYELEVALQPGTSARAAVALELSTRNRAPAGVLTTAMPLMGNTDGYLCAGLDPMTMRGQVAHSYACAVNRWRVSWQAPAADEGSVTLYLSAVDANADSKNAGDVTHSLVLGIPSPSTVGQNTTGCSSTGGELTLILVLLLSLSLRRGRGLLLLALIPTLALAAPKKKTRAPPPPPKTAPQPQPEPAPAPAPEPLVEPTPPQKPTEPPFPPKRVEPVPAPVIAAIPDTSKLPGAFELDARLGFGFRSVSFSSPSYATPFRAAFGFPSLSLGITFYPARLLRSSALSGLHLQGRYAVGWVLQQLPLAGAQVLPSDGRVALGYSIRAGVLELTPRALYRIAIGGVERNPFFDDGYFQSLGGELAIGVVTSGFFLHVTPRAGAIVDVGTQMVRGYGASRGGFTWGGSAEVGWRFSPFFLLSGTYQLTVAKTEFAGQGERTLEAMTVNDTIHAGYVVLTLEH